MDVVADNYDKEDNDHQSIRQMISWHKQSLAANAARISIAHTCCKCLKNCGQEKENWFNCCIMNVIVAVQILPCCFD